MKNREVLKKLVNLPDNVKDYIDTKIPKNYAGSSSAGGIATQSAKTTGTLTIQTNGTSAATFNGSANKTVDITPDSIGASASGHTHSTYALASHTHNYAGSSSAGGAATSANKVNSTLTIQTNGTSAATFNGSANKTVNITPDSIGAATSGHTHSTYALASHTHNYAGSSSAGGAATEALKTSGTLTIQTNGTSAATFNGSANKTINITPDSIGASPTEHAHSNYITSSDIDLNRDESDNTVYIVDKNGNNINQGVVLHDVIHISPSSFTDIFSKVTIDGVYYLLTTVTVTYNGTSYSLKGLYDIRKTTSGGWSLFGYNNLLYFGTDSSLTITSLTSLPTFISNKVLTQVESEYATSEHTHGLLNSNFTKEINASSGGWSLINDTYKGFLLKSLRGGSTVPDWFNSAYSPGIIFGGSDTKGIVSMSYSSPSVSFAGGNEDEPKWNMKVEGTTGKTYSLDNYLPLSGGTLTGKLILNSNSGLNMANGVDFGAYDTEGNAITLATLTPLNIARFGTTKYETYISTSGELRVVKDYDSSSDGYGNLRIRNIYFRNTLDDSVNHLGKIESDSTGAITLSSTNAVILKGHSGYTGSTNCELEYKRITNSGNSYPVLRPLTTGLARLGTTSLRWQGIYSATAVDVGSDRRLKEDIVDVNENLENMFMELRPVTYKLKENDDHRIHSGFIAQEVEESMNNNNISYEEFAALNKSMPDDDVEPKFYTEDGEPDYEYSLKYTEFIPLNTHMIQKAFKRIEELEAKIKELESKLEEV